MEITKHYEIKQDGWYQSHTPLSEQVNKVVGEADLCILWAQ